MQYSIANKSVWQCSTVKKDFPERSDPILKDNERKEPQHLKYCFTNIVLQETVPRGVNNSTIPVDRPMTPSSEGQRDDPEWQSTPCVRASASVNVYRSTCARSAGLRQAARAHTGRRTDAEAVTLPDWDGRDHEVGRILELLLTYLLMEHPGGRVYPWDAQLNRSYPDIS